MKVGIPLNGIASIHFSKPVFSKKLRCDCGDTGIRR